MTDIEKNVLQPQRRLRKSKVFFLSLSLFLGALIIMFFEFRSLINTSAPTWHAAPNVPISAPKNASSNRIEKGTPLPSNLSNQSAESQGVLYEPTDALRKLADKLHLPLPAKSRLRPSPSNLKPTHTDKILLLLEAAKNKLYEFPSDVDKRISELQPDTMEKFAQSLRKVIPNTDDVQMVSSISYHFRDFLRWVSHNVFFSVHQFSYFLDHKAPPGFSVDSVFEIVLSLFKEG